MGFFAEKNVSSKATHIFFSQHISIYAIFNYQSFSDILTINIVSFELQGPGCQIDLLTNLGQNCLGFSCPIIKGEDYIQSSELKNELIVLRV